MAFGSVATSKVKVILEAQDNVTTQLNKIKANFARADRELDARLQQRVSFAQEMNAWDKKHANLGSFSYSARASWFPGALPRSMDANKLTRQAGYGPWVPGSRSSGFYNPFISGSSVIAALSTQTRNLYATTQRYIDGLIKINQWMGKASAKLFEVGGKLTMTGGTMAGVGVAGLTSLYKPLSDFGDFQRNMLLAQSKTGASAAQYNSMVGAARQYAANSSWDPQQVSSVMEKMASMGFKPDQITSSFKQIMDYSRAVGQDDPMWAAQGIGAMMNSFGVNAADSGTVSKIVDKMTAAIVNSPLRDDTLRESMKQVAPLVKDKRGTIDDMLAWNMVMAQKGIDGSIAGTAQKNFLMRTGNSKIVDYMGKFGIAVFDDAGNRRSARQILADIAQIKKVMTDKEWDAFAFKVFGARSQSGIGAMFDDSALENAYSVLADAEGLSWQIREQMESGVFGSLKRIWSALQDMFLEVGSVLETTLKDLEPKIIAWFHWATETVGDNPRFVKWLMDAYTWLVQIGAPIAAIGVSITAIGSVLAGIQTIASFLLAVVVKGLYPFVMGIAKFLVGIFTTCGAVVGSLLIALAVIVGIVAHTFQWSKIFQAMFNGGEMTRGFKLMGWSLWESLKWASSHFFRYFFQALVNLASLMWEIVVFPFYSVMHAASHIPGLQSFGQAADKMLVAPGEMARAGVSGFFDDLDRENERTRKEYFKDLEQYSEEAKAKNFSEASDLEKRGNPVAMLSPMNDELAMIQRQQREEQASAKWAIYFPGTQRPAELEEAEKEIEKYENAEEKRRRALIDAALASDKSAEKEEKAAAKKAAAAARAEEKRKQEEERKAKEFKANQLKRQAELTKGLKPIYKGSMEAAKWLLGLGDYSKDGKTDRELAQEQVDHLASIDEQLKNGEVVFQGV